MQILNGASIVQMIASKQIDPKTLNKHQQRAAEWYLWTETDSRKSQIAAMLQMPDYQVRRDITYIEREHLAFTMPKPGDVEKIVGRLVTAANLVIQRALAKGQLGLVWKVESDLADKLGRFGYAKYDGTMLSVHTGDVIEKGGQKTTLKIEQTNFYKGMTDDERNRIDRILAESQSRINHEQPRALGDGTQDDPGPSV